MTLNSISNHTGSFTVLFPESSLHWPREPPFLASWTRHQNSERRYSWSLNTPKIFLYFKRSFDSTILGKANSYLRYFSSVRVRGQRAYYCGFHFWINEMAVDREKEVVELNQKVFLRWQRPGLLANQMEKSHSLTTHRALGLESVVTSFT